VSWVLDEVEPIARAELAQRMADVAGPPRNVLLRLANDEIIISEPILRRSTALDDAELERIARSHSQAHLAAIAARPKLSERVTDVLVARGDDQVVDTVAANEGARFSEQGFATLADRACTNEGLLDRLASRNDLPADITARLAPMITEVLAGRLKATGADADSSTLNELAAESGFVLAERLRAATKVARSLEFLIEQVEKGQIKIDEAVIELADVDATPDLGKLIAARVDLPSSTVFRALCAPAEEPVALLCRAAGIKMNGYSAIVRMRRRRRRGSDKAAEQALKRYEQIPLEMAERVLRFLKVRDSAAAS